MIDVTIKLKPGKTLKDVALEIQQLNQYVGQMGINPETGEDYFPRAIPCNPDSEKQEGFVGVVNTPPDEYGRVNVRLPFEYLDLSALPAQPSTFSFIVGVPIQTGHFA